MGDISCSSNVSDTSTALEMSNNLKGTPLKFGRIVLLSVLLLKVPVAHAAPETPTTASNGLIAYVLWEDLEGDPDWQIPRIFTVDPEGGEPVRRTEGLDSEWNARWSPDGSQMLFLRTARSIDPDTGAMRIEPTQLFIEQADGSDPRQVTFGGRSIYEAEWSPDGQQIAFTRAYKPWANRADLYVIDADGSNLLRLTNNKNWNQGPGARNSVRRPRWSPSGRKIAFLPSYRDFTGPGVYTVRSDGTRKPKRVLSDVHVSEMDWSPTDGRLALAGLSDGGLGIFNLSTGMVVRIGKPADAVEWSPDGLRLAYEQSDGEARVQGVRVVRASGKQDHAVPVYPETGNWYSAGPAWSPDGDLIAFQIREVDDECSPELRVGASSGGSDVVVVELDCGEYISEINWQPVLE